jgi:hypothetical protein
MLYTARTCLFGLWDCLLDEGLCRERVFNKRIDTMVVGLGENQNRISRYDDTLQGIGN